MKSISLPDPFLEAYRRLMYHIPGIAAALLVSDELFTGKWNPGFLSPAFLETRKAACQALGSLCRNIPHPT